MTAHPTQSTELWPIVDRMCSSIREFGFKIPVLACSDGEVVDGHLRLKAARKLGISEIPVILCDEWTRAQVKGSQRLCRVPVLDPTQQTEPKTNND